MTRKTKKATRARAAGARRSVWRIVGVILLAVVVVVGYRIWKKNAILLFKRASNAPKAVPLPSMV